MPKLEITQFTAFNEEQIDAGSHWTRRGKLDDSSKVWFCKTMRDAETAKLITKMVI